MKTCKTCNNTKEYKNFYKYKPSKDRYRYDCIVCFKLKKSQYQKNNKQQCYKYTKKWKQNNKADFKEQRNQYFRKRYKENKKFAISHNLRDRLRKALKSKKWLKNNTFQNYIGCTLEELKNYLNQQFKPDMTWENHGTVWHIDHIIPLSSAKTEEELYKLCHYTNLQPLYVKDNIIKSNKIE